MPVWHERTRRWREVGDLQVVGLAQEQHPDRTALFAQWQGFDWPILWDPFHLSGSTAVPNLWAIDEHGVVRLVQPSPESLEADFLAREFPAPEGLEARPPPVNRALLDEPPVAGALPSVERALAGALWEGESSLDAAVEVLRAFAASPAAGPHARFQLGVALRMRHDSSRARPGDFQAALESWNAALTADPAQYIWRRRLQQYGPRLDKPYPFYDWVESARGELRARGVEPLELRSTLSGAELAGRAADREPTPPEGEPDPTGAVPRAPEDWLSESHALAFDTAPAGPGGSARRGGARVHLSFRPAARRGVHWNNSAEPPRVWVDVPAGWTVDHRLVQRTQPRAELSDEVRVFDFEISTPPAAEGAAASTNLRGYLLFHACTEADGRCRYLRRDFAFEVAFPARRG